MYGRSGGWIGNTVAGLTLGRVWLYQDFAAGSGPNLTISANNNGTGLPFNSLNIVDNSAVITKSTNEPIFTNVAELPSQLVSVTGNTGASVLLDSTPAVGEGTVRIWYLYAILISDIPADATLAPQFVTEQRTVFLDSRFLNANLNLSDLNSASTARTNLGLGTIATHDASEYLATANNLSELTATAATARTNLGLGTAATHADTDFEVPLTFSTGLTRTVNTITVNTTQNITKLSNLTSNGFVKTSGGDGTLSVDTNTYQVGPLTGDVTTIGAAATIGANKVTLAMMATVATATFLGRTTAGTGNVEALTVTQATALLNAFVSGGAKGLVPDATGSTAKFLRGDATWVDLPAVRYKAGKTASNLTIGTTTKAIVFATARGDALYTPSFFLINTTDSSPIGIPVRIIAISATGFTAEWDDALPTGNYVGYWSILEHYDP